MTPPRCSGATAKTPFTTIATEEDPYCYQVGFGNRFATEAIPGTLPLAANTPQRCRYDLFSEQLNGTAFISPRVSQQHVWLYRIRPSVAHDPLVKGEQNELLESDFSMSNKKVEFTPTELAWDPFSMPNPEEKIDFIQGIHTIAGHGDPTLREGLAVHMYLANVSMQNKAFCNNDGDMLILPQEGCLDLQTELGRIRVRPGELVVIQAGIRFKVTLPDGGPVRGYIQEIYGTHYELPELGPIGSNGMAMPRDFEIPVASFDIDQSQWSIVYKMAGKLYSSKQNHTPFDVVAWHGNYAPYKYALEKFINSATVDREQSDPTIYCVLTAKSKIPHVSLTDFLVFTPKWSVTTNTFRPPYYHRNTATEIMGMAYGTWAGTGHALAPGGLSYEASFMPHGESYERWVEATTQPLEHQRVAEGTLAFMFHITAHVAITEWARKCSGVLNLDGPKWDGLGNYGFLSRLDEVDKDLEAMGLPKLGKH
ncbi:homogentisate 1,2-dioxygenase [Saccharata proteae CBS 121410]|uniref:homogentisate 1,2-dioxygenase n=1 Tax=Saccharata proteae CBS 121410 TaxID=1314787 RepID=A0A9P4HPL1_9PEZI|nr:homogentisate 1,2-dioxygenase [Saccharata proteae CBS 121410]